MSQLGYEDLANTPAASPPAGQTSNFLNPPSQQTIMIAVSTTMSFLTVVFVSLRLYTSLRITRLPGIEDWLCVLAVVFSFGYIGIILSLSYVSRHMWDVPEIWFTENYWKIRFAGNTLQALAYFTSRMPILLLYLRLFGQKRSFRIACYVAITAAFGVYLASIPLLSYFCTPSAGGDWGSLDVFAKCKRLLDWAMVQGSCDIVLNIYILLLPLTVVLGLHMPPRKKLGVLAIFLTGLL
ncbi:Uu.00g077770.m01.CDS01 [Anthostomella pinea]|uniref:Uu.00g077770.m01.CDS01 n=1 Tax=Anthostomella pinea TaxID=933095 RepID=A0AAI8VKH2_9PEZI|nr:Uu.00g077770.m01.CDS01 [Anthostomella pinea]